MKNLWVLVLTCMLPFSSANAQSTIQSFASSYDLALPPSSVAIGGSPLSMLYNPAGLAWEPSFETLLMYQERLATLDDLSRVRGVGMLMGFGRLGLGLQYLKDQSVSSDYLKVTLAGSLIQVGPWFSIGTGLEILDPTESTEHSSLDWLVGAMLRPSRYASVGLVGRNLGKANLAGGTAAHPAIDLGLAFRPLWFAPERLTLAADARFMDQHQAEFVDKLGVRFTGQLNIINGLGLYGSADLKGNFSAGLMIDLGKASVGAFLNGVHTSAGTDKMSNLLSVARISAEDRPGFVLEHHQTVEIVLNRDLVTDEAPKFSMFGSHTSVQDLERAIRKAAHDQRIEALLFKLEDTELRPTDIQELRDALAEFRHAGKRIFFHLSVANDLNYYLASAGDVVVLDPSAVVNITGPKVEATFLRGTLDLLGIKPEFERVGKYKSFMEQLAQREPSEPYREVMNSLADEYADQYFSAVAAGRKMTVAQVQALVDRGFMQPQEAKSAGLVDEVSYYDEIASVMEKHLGHAPIRKGNYLYRRSHSDNWGERPVVAVVYASGTIAYSGGFGQTVDARQIAQTLSDLRDNSRVVAVVLRVDSPGGDGSASDLIWHEVIRLRERKPVVVSMSSLSASGGYYISCPANYIMADPGTITGSIGVFAMFFDLSGLYEKLGISHETVKRGKFADLSSTFRGRTLEEMEMLKKLVQDFYQGFIERVANGRKLTKEQVDQVGQGRVWTGRQAKEKGLVDELGGLSKAINKAKELAGMKPNSSVTLIHLPQPKFSLQGLMREFGLATEEPLPLPAVIQDSLRQMMILASLNADPVLALLPFYIHIK